MTAQAMQRAPHPALRALVGTYHGYHYTDLEPGVHHGLPSGELTVVIAFDDPVDVGWMGDERSRTRQWAMASGLHDAPALIRHGGLQHGIQLGLTPLGVRVLFGMPAGELAATMVALDELVGPASSSLYDDLCATSSWTGRFDALDRHLLALAAKRPEPASAIRDELGRAWTALVHSHGALRIEQLAREVGWSRRHLSARFGSEFGLTPKQVARVLRLQRSRSQLLDRELSLADVAVTCGYADQAHMAREWRDLAGYSPSQWLREEFPFIQDAAVGA